METDNFNNSLIEIRHKERMLRSSKSRSMTPVIRSTSNSEESASAKNDISSARLSTGRKVVTSSTKSVSKTKTVGGKTSVTVVVEKNLSQEKSTFPKDIQVDDESATRLSTRNDNMELRSERQLKTARYSNRSVANGTGKDETTATSTRTTANKSTTNQNRTVRTRTSDYSSDDDEEVVEDETLKHDAQSQRVLNVYQGEFWNKFPKTDFTYSPVSKDHYREVAPGVSVKPNMSRSTYQNASANRTSTPYTLPTRGSKSTASTTTTTTRRSRFFDASKAGTNVPAYINDYASLDSDEDEVDNRVRAEVAASVARSPSVLTYFTSFFLTIWTVVTTTWTTTVETTKHFVGLQNNGASLGYSTPVRRSIGRSWWGRMLDSLYLLPAYVSSADLSLLTSSSTSKGSRSKRLGLFSAFLLLLLLLLCGWWLFYDFGIEEDTGSRTSLLLSDAWTAMRAWMGTFGGWCRTFGGWIFLPFAAKQWEQEEPIVKEYESYTVSPMTVVTIPLGATPPTFDVDMLVDRLLASQRFEKFLAQRLGRDDPVEEVLASVRFTDWIASRVDGKETDVEALANEIWSTGRLQQLVDAQLDESRRTWLTAHSEREAIDVELLRASLRQELDVKSQYFEVHNAKLAGEIARLKEEIDRKLNASITEMKAKLREDLMSNEEAKRGLEDEIRLLKVRLEKCCNKTTVAIPWQDIERYVLRYTASMYGVADAEKVDHAELRALVGNMFVGRQQFEAALANVTAHHRAEMREVSDQSAQTIMDTISERITDEFASHVGASSLHRSDGLGRGSASAFVGVGGGLTDGRVLEIVNRAIMTYDADKTGMVDYALESSGGSVISTRCTESYYKHSASMTLFGIPYWYPVNTPRTVIQPGVHPGECWAFRGSQGFLVIQLAGQVRISSFSVEHIPRSLAFSGNIDSAPKDFSVWGLQAENDLEPTELGKYTYLKNSTSLQYFLVARSDIQPFKVIELRIDSNHGNLEYTCLYRFRVHGTWVSY